MLKRAAIGICLLSSCWTLAALASDSFYINPNSSAAQWVKAHPDDPRAKTINTAIAQVPSAMWFTGTSQSNDQLAQAVSRYVNAASQAQRIPLLVAYNLPGRDCSGGASAGGASDAQNYRGWIDNFISGVGSQPAMVVLEPDALADSDCLTPAKRQERLGLIHYALQQFQQHAVKTKVYLDAGNAGWKPADAMADLLNAAGINLAQGFALNVSNFYRLEQSTAYGEAINARLAANYGYRKSMLIDTGRSGNGSENGQWCNPLGRKIGSLPGKISADAMAVWVKQPGDSDGASSPSADCHNGPAAGVFSPELAVRLIEGK